MEGIVRKDLRCPDWLEGFRDPVSIVSRINAYIEEEVQRRLQDLHHVIGSDSNTSADLMKVSEGLSEYSHSFLI